MIVTMVHVWVKNEYLEDFIEASLDNHRNTIREPGNLRFDVLRDADDPAKFIFYEVFRNEQAISDHKATAHYQRWRDTVADWMTQPRKGIKFIALAPAGEEKWQTGSI